MLRLLCRAAVIAFFSPALFAQWATPVIDGVISPGEYGSNNQLNNAGNTGQTWYMTWDSTNLYIGITNANINEAAVIYITPNPLNPPNSGTNANGNLTGFNYDGTDFSSLPFLAQFVTYVKDGYEEYRLFDGNGNWGNSTANYGAYADNSGTNTREFAIPWNAINGNNGIPASFVFFGYLTSSGGYVYGQAPSDNPGAFIGTSATYTQYYYVINTGNGTSTPPFSVEQPGGFPPSVTANFTHDTFNSFYRSPEGSQPENSPVTLRFTTAHADSIAGVTLRTYLFDTGSGVTTGPVDVNMPFDQNITVNGTELDAWIANLTLPSAPTIYYYKFEITRGTTVGWYSDDYVDNYDNVNKDGTGVAYNTEPYDSFEIDAYDPNFQTPAWLQSANVYHIMPDRFRNGDQTNDYCRPGATTGCPVFYGNQQAFTYTDWNTAICDPRNPSSPCYNEFGQQFYGGDLVGIQNELDYVQSLGFDTFYLNPIFSARSYHRYDTDNYYVVDPALGGNAAFTALQQELTHRGMNVILDGVFNHSSSDGSYFDEYDRYGGTAPNIGACLSLQSMWRTYFNFLDGNVPCQPSDYVGWYGNSTLPTYDHSNTLVQNFFYDGSTNVMQNWYDAGANGWRFDVADDPNFPHSWWVNTRTFAKGYNSNGPLIGEIWPDASQWLAGDQMDSVMNYRFRKNVTGFARAITWCDDDDNGANCITGLTPSQFDHANHAVRDDYPDPATMAMLNLIDSHDTNRALYVLTVTGDNGLVQAKQRLELAAIFQFTYLGAPMVMYGDEIALNSPSLASSSNGPIGDPYSRAPYPWLDQAGDPTVYGPPDTDVQSFYTTLAHMRKQYPVFSSGYFSTLLTGDTQQPSTAANTYAYAMTSSSLGTDSFPRKAVRRLASPPTSAAVVALNNGNSTNTPAISVTGVFADGTSVQDVISGSTYTVSGGTLQITLAPLTGAIFLPAPVTIDTTPPIASITTTPSANSGGWLNTSPVTVNLNGSDPGGSGVSQLRYWIGTGSTTAVSGSATTTSLSGDGMNTVNLRVLDNAGNISPLATLAVNIDLDPPAVTVTGVVNGATYSKGRVPMPGCMTTDALSGVAVPATVNTTGGNGNGVGQFTSTCSGGQDVAGNIAAPVSATFTVTATYTLTTSVSPAGGGSITPATKTYPANTTVQVKAKAAAGYAFSGFSGSLTGTTNPQSITLTANANVVANFVPLAPILTAQNLGAMTVSNSTVNVTLGLKNTGNTTAGSATITSITGISVVTGSGSVSVASGVPADLGNISQGGGARTTVVFNWPSTASKITYTVNFTASGGYSGSTVITMGR